MNLPMTGKVALITGAASGIGRAAAIAFAKNGANVVVADTQSDGGMQTVQLIEKSGSRSIFLECDVSIEADVEKMMELTIREFGKLDYAFNNAGVEGIRVITSELTETEWNRLININLKGVWLCLKHELKQMNKQKNGSIVNCSSIAGKVGFAMASAYVASKHGVIGLTEAASLEFANSGIRINSICPGVIRTPMVDRFLREHPTELEQLRAKEPMGRFGTPEEVADAVLWLCSDSSSYITGHALIVDGGWTAQ